MKRILIILLTISCSLFTIHCSAQLQGQALIDSMLKELSRQKEDTNKVNILDELSWSYIQTDPDESKKYALQCIELAYRLNWKKGMAKANGTMAVFYYYKSDYPKALEYYKKQLPISEAIGDKKSTASAFSNIGMIFMNQSEYRNALGYLFKALKIAEEEGLKSLAASVANNIGGVYQYQQDYSMALKYYTECITFNEQLGNNQSVAAVYANIGSMYQQQGNYSQSLEYLFKALKIVEEHSYKQYAPTIYTNIGKVYEKQEDYTEAVAYYEKSIKIAEEIGNKNVMAWGFRNIGSLYFSIVIDTTAKSTLSRTNLARNTVLPNSGKYQPTASIPLGKPALLNGAIKYLEKGLDIALAISELSLAWNCYERLSEVYTLTGDYKKALSASNNYHAIKDSVYSIENKEQILKMGMKNDYDRQHLTDSLKTVEKEKIAAINLQKQKSYTYLGIVGIMLLVGFSFFISKERAKSEKLLLNILPTEVAKELKAKGSAEAKLINEVTVLFTDFKGFTQLSEKLSPKELVGEINTCFSAFDNIMQ
ncbi:MAG: tetratricopeptide repeat protein, partial [Taibaiella sp.]|nr:tetratricopeptide repeat protein [Taibaiella sp.]